MKVLRYKVNKTGNKILQTSDDVIKPPRLQHNDLSILEDELKPECDALSNLSKVICNLRENLEQLTGENQSVVETLKALRIEMNGELIKHSLIVLIHLSELLESLQQNQLLRSQMKNFQDIGPIETLLQFQEAQRKQGNVVSNK